MGPDRTTRVERILTRLGLWGAMRGGSALVAAVIASVLLLELLVPSAARLFPDASLNAIHFIAVGIGLLLGLIGHFSADFWDRAVFQAFYGDRGRWIHRASPPLLVFPRGEPLKRSRSLAVQGLARKPEPNTEIDREAVRLARRQVERWERIERPLILARFVRGFLWPGVFAGILAWGGALASPLLGAPSEAPRLLAAGGASLALALAFLVPYSRLRAEYLVRLYEDVASHARKKKPERR